MQRHAAKFYKRYKFKNQRGYFSTTSAKFIISTILIVFYIFDHCAGAYAEGTLVHTNNKKHDGGVLHLGAAVTAEENEIEFASLDGATQILPAPPPLSPHLPTLKTTSAPLTSSYTEVKGGEIASEVILRYNESPFIVRQDIEILKGAKLVIEPGVRVEFLPTVGITVKGVLQAVGTSTLRITLTSHNQQLVNKIELPDEEERGLRLVDGPTPLEGRLEIFHKGSWRPVCTNSKNWTIADYTVACRQMGLEGGRFWNWVDRTPGYYPRMLYENPQCQGSENSLTNCAWHTRQLGSGVCDYHNDIGVQCLPIYNQKLGYWRGIYFENAPSGKSLDKDNTVYSALSHSALKYVDITRAGLGHGNMIKSAVEVIGIPPITQHVVVSHSAYTGFNVTRPLAGFSMQNVTIRKCNGIGIFVNSSQGNVELEGCNIIDNTADGVKYIGHDLRSDERRDRAFLYDFCTLPTTSGQTYPISLTFTQKYYAGAMKECSKYFFTRPGYLLTVHFEYFVLEKNETATIEIFDGASVNDRLLFEWKVRNNTRPQSVTSIKEKLFIRITAEMHQEVSGFLRVSSGVTSGYDLKVVESNIEDNGGRGIAIDNIRSRLHVHRSSVSGNGHVSGVHVTSGAGDVNITSSIISFNQGDGVNITYYGGNRNISRSSINSNKGSGVSVWLNQTTDIDRVEYIAINQTTVVEYSHIGHNIEAGILHGNYCDPIWVNITGNNFNDSLGNDITVESCWRNTKNRNENLNLQIGHNVFEHSQKNSIYLSPALNLLARLEYNHFRYGLYGAIYIRNDYIFQEFKFMPVHILIQNNYFIRNKGIYVVSLGLSPYSRREVQSLLFTRNFVRENKILETFGPLIEGSEGIDGSGRLNPRSRVAAPVVVASSNVDIFRNILHNLDSTYEIGSQLCDQSEVINATYNWLGHSDENKIYTRLFHRNDRYNLAKILYIPYLLHNSNPSSSTIIAISTLVPRFFHEGYDTIGGEVDGQETIPTGTYTVTKDINIRPGGKLTLQPGAVLKFVPSVGMMVAGKLEARGRHPDDILFTLKRETIITVENTTSLDGEMESLDVDMIDVETERIVENNETPRMPIRLVGGAGDYEGRLQMFIDGRWGTVCDYGWSVLNAALVCHHLGYTLNPQDWRLLRSQMPNVGVTEDVVVSNVRCTEQDRDIMKCRAEYFSRGEFENSCSHENDVGIRCYEGAWAGVRFSMLAERADLQYVTIEKAGLFDYSTNSFKPAIQMDFARHNLENVRIVNNLNDGLGVIYADLFGGRSINNVKKSEFVGNRGSGISLKQLDLHISDSIIKDNGGSGISHDPVISAFDQNEIGGWFKKVHDFNAYESDYDPYILPFESSNIELNIWSSKYIRTEELLGGDSVTRKILVRCPTGFVIGIQLLNPIQNFSSERILILDSQTENSRSDLWDVRRDLNVFPATSSSYAIIIYYESGMNALGGTVLMLSTVAAPVQNIRNRVVKGPIPTLSIRSTKIRNNLRGISTIHYNRYFGNETELYLRKANESIKIVNSEISYNIKEGILVKSPFWDVISSNLSEKIIHVNSSIIRENGHGIRQLSKDLRSSNNLFHYVLQDTTVEDNTYGGFQVTLPYVWQYNENFTHSIYFGNTTWQRNRNFFVDVRGHYAVFNITNNVFINNHCPRGLIALEGMEKRIKFDYNRIENNNAKFIFEFRADSLSEIIGTVPAIVSYNTIKNNAYDATSSYHNMPMRLRDRKYPRQNRVPTSVIRLDGIQNIVLYRNLIAENKMSYNLVAGVRSARLNNYFYAKENWWGSMDIRYIESKIFDFDNWNNHADVIYQPFLIEDTFDASVSLVLDRKDEINLDSWSGGRIYKDLTLTKRSQPYHITSDITIMPGVTLTIKYGVVMEFDPSIGILVLGTLTAIGYKESPIIMRPFRRSTHEAYVTLNKRSLEEMGQAQTFDSIRLCTNTQNCSSYSDGAPVVNEGFLEYFNHTTLQWVPICDSRFTERNAQVVCRELGFDPLNVYYGHDRRIEFHTNSLTRIWSWVQPLECKGDEARMEHCYERLNGQLYGHRHECHWDDTFVFVSCNGLPEEQIYWGGIRFANSDFEENHYQYRIHDTHTHGLLKNKKSHLEMVVIENAGILHNQKAAAIQAIFKTPIIQSINILNSANHGINLVSPIDTITLNLVNITNALGTGISILSLTGEGRESDESSFTPLKDLDMPYELFSMINICDPQKVLTVEERVLVYYKYDNNPVNCVKILTSAYRAKPMGFRLLQSNLYNHSKLYGRMDSIRLFDGDIYNVTSIFLGQIESDTKNQKSFFKTIGPTLSIQLMASGAPETYGFIAEIVTVPISTIGQHRDALHNITYSEISGAIKGAITYASAGEVTPTLTLTSNRIENNCLQLYGNFSTCQSALNFDVQNMHSLYFKNNLVMKNQGGLRIRADSRGSATSLLGYIHHNLFYKNRNRPALHIEGRQSSPYQEIELFRNYFAQNQAGFEDVIRLRQVVSNFSYNFVHSNIGGRIVEVSGFEKVRLPIYQTTSHNGFYGNVATNWMGRATIVAGTAGQQYVDNVFENFENDYEMITVNNSILSIDFRNSTIEIWRSRIDARHNYWSFNNSISVQSRIRDKSDDPLLLEVQAVPFQMNNQTILDGKCPPGWSQVHDTCFIYVGAPMSFYEAREFCRSENSSMPFIRTDSTTLWNYLKSQMTHLKYPEKVWVQDFNHIDRCTSFVYREVEVQECSQTLGFICEIDPKVAIDPLSWRADVFAISIISAFILAIILLIMVTVCWYAKSKHRHVQRLQRRNSIRQSLRSLNSIDPQGSLRRRNFHISTSTGTLTKPLGQDYKQMIGNGSIDSMEKSVLSSDGGSYDGFEHLTDQPHHSEYQRPQQRFNEYISHKSLHPQHYQLPEQQKVATIGSTSKAPSGHTKIPTAASNYAGDEFELSYRNEGFRDNSTFSGTQNNSASNSIIDGQTPIIHHTDKEDELGSDYYGNASTLPLRDVGSNENAAFLAELKRSLPEYDLMGKQSHTSFLPNRSPQPLSSSQTNNSDIYSQSLPYEQKIDNLNFTAISPLQDPTSSALYRNDVQLNDLKRPDSYYTAVRSSKAQPQAPIPTSSSIAPSKTRITSTAKLKSRNIPTHLSKQTPTSTPIPTSTSQAVTAPINQSNSPQLVQKATTSQYQRNKNQRPRTVYKTDNEDVQPYHRSKSEALLETDFDDNSPSLIPLYKNGRSYSQPLETAM